MGWSGVVAVPPRGSQLVEELEALWKQRLAKLQVKHGDPGNAAQQEAKCQEAEMRNRILAQVLDQSAGAGLVI